MLSRNRKISPDTMRSFSTKGFSARKYTATIEDMLQSGFVTRVYCGQQLKSVMKDGDIDEDDRELLIQLLERQVATWNAVALVDTLMLSVVTGFAFSSASANASDGEYVETLSSVFDVLVTITTLGFLFSTVITVLYLAYSACLTELDDLVWFLCTWRPELPITLCVIALVFMVRSRVASSLILLRFSCLLITSCIICSHPKRSSRSLALLATALCRHRSVSRRPRHRTGWHPHSQLMGTLPSWESGLLVCDEGHVSETMEFGCVRASTSRPLPLLLS